MRVPAQKLLSLCVRHFILNDTMEYRLLAEKLGMGEEQLVEAAIVEREAKQLEQRIRLLDEGLRHARKERCAVPGSGDCQYIAFIEAAKHQGIDIGNLLEVRVKTYQMLANHPDYYGLWVDETERPNYWEFVQSVLVEQTYNVTLQALVDATGLGVRVFYLRPDVLEEDWILDTHTSRCPTATITQTSSLRSAI